VRERELEFEDVGEGAPRRKIVGKIRVYKRGSVGRAKSVATR
jgi:hypothetical protein